MEEVLRALNALVEQGVIENYAIGGAMAAAFYIEAVQTEDVDAFVFLPQSSSGLLDLSHIYGALSALGGVAEREYIRFGEWPLQILPDATPLIAEAIREATETEYEGVRTRVCKPQYLCCIALQTGRAKDLLRVRMFLDQHRVESDMLEAMAESLGLGDKLRRVELLADG